ncbi:MAG: tRNA pseudouridine(13) synthase TruD [Candidatus Micrarchaeota archaeon]|nr:tRNA pseudouridine(13) synthase TruD [Candidatus Micrarchaeota archaeon]
MYRLKAYPEDFVVDEMLATGGSASVAKSDPAAQGPFVWVAVKKVNWNTLDLAREIAKRLRVGEKRVNYAGIKDRNAVAYQVFSINTREDGAAVSEKLSGIKDIEVMAFWRAARWIKGEDMAGNMFDITLRDCSFTAADVMRNAADRFPNYFGEQRFGSMRKNTATVGLKVLKGDYEGAVSEYFPEEVGLDRWEERMLQQSRKMGAERFVRSNARLFKLCVHALQSLVFNRELEMRIRDGETGVLEGEYACGRNKFGFADINVEGGEFTVGLLVGSECRAVNKYKQAILDEYGISRESFRRSDVRGGYRTLYAPIIGLDAVDMGNGVVRLKFALQKGSYATVLIDELVGEK